MTRQTHKPMQVKGKATPSPARTATDTGSTSSGRRPPQEHAATDAVGEHNYEMLPVPPALREDEKVKPVTLEHLKTGKAIVISVVAIVGTVATGVWWLSQSSSKLDQHSERLKDLTQKTDRLLGDSAIASTKLQTLEARTTKVEDAVFVPRKSSRQ